MRQSRDRRAATFRSIRGKAGQKGPRQNRTKRSDDTRISRSREQSKINVGKIK